MTTIVYRDGVMAGDSRAFSGDKHPTGSKVKVRRLADGTLIGVTSVKPGGNEAVIQWWEGGRKADAMLPEFFTMLAVIPNGEAYLANDTKMVSGPLKANFFTSGSGEQYAYGACLMGATAVEAVRVGCNADPWSGLPIYAISHDAPHRWRVDQ